MSSRNKIIFYSFVAFIFLIISISLVIKQGNLFALSTKEQTSNNHKKNNEVEKKGTRLSNKVSPQSGFMAPDFSFPDINGNSVSLSQFKGKVVFLNIWATWCGPCRVEMPAMEKLYQKFKKDDFTILAVSIDRGGKSVVVPFLKEYGITFPTLLSPDGSIQKIYMVRALPTSFIIDKTGRIVARVTGARDWFGEETIETFEYLINEK